MQKLCQGSDKQAESRLTIGIQRLSKTHERPSLKPPGRPEKVRQCALLFGFCAATGLPAMSAAQILRERSLALFVYTEVNTA
jgi:hypothetical protein